MTATEPATRIRLGVATIQVRSSCFARVWKIRTSIERHGVLSWPVIVAVRAIHDLVAREVAPLHPGTLTEVQHVLEYIGELYTRDALMLLLIGNVMALGTLIDADRQPEFEAELWAARKWVEDAAAFDPAQYAHWLMLCELGAGPAEAVAAVVALDGM